MLHDDLLSGQDPSASPTCSSRKTTLSRLSTTSKAVRLSATGVMLRQHAEKRWKWLEGHGVVPMTFCVPIFALEPY